MNLTKKITLVLGLAAASASFAQTAPADTTVPVGVLGQSYTELSFGVTDIKHFAKDQYSLGVVANSPVSPNLDVSLGYDYSWFNSYGHSNSVLAAATAYTTLNGNVKPFIAGAVGYSWDHVSVGPATFRDDYGTWGGAVGVEIPVAGLTVTPRIVYADDFRGSANSVNQWSYGVDVNYWIHRKAAVFGAVDYIDADGDDAYAFTAGVRIKF